MTRACMNTIARAAASEIQRRNKERGYATIATNGFREPVVTVEEMRHLIMQFYDVAVDHSDGATEQGGKS